MTEKFNSSEKSMSFQEFVMRRAKLLFGSYRRGDANDPETYGIAIAAVLECYDPQLIAEVTDPRIGIATTEKFRSYPPNAGELKAYCEGLATHKKRLNDYRAMPKASAAAPRLPPVDPETRPQGWLANLLVPKDARGYDAMVKRAETGPRSEWRWDAKDRGIWVALPWFDQVKAPPASGLARVRVPTDDELRAMYKKPSEAA